MIHAHGAMDRNFHASEKKSTRTGVKSQKSCAPVSLLCGGCLWATICNGIYGRGRPSILDKGRLEGAASGPGQQAATLRVLCDPQGGCIMPADQTHT